jgi:hypothetical protein
MKKFTGFLFSATLLLFIISGTANALIFTDTQDLDRTLYESGTTSWSHSTPDLFSVPPDTVNSATLEIFAHAIDGNNELVYVQGSYQGVLHNRDWVWTGFFSGEYQGTTFDIADIFTAWNAGDSLNVTLSYSEPNFLWIFPTSFTLDSSVFTLDYESGSGASAPVPEPATLLLLGSGLLGMAGFRKKIKR